MHTAPTLPQSIPSHAKKDVYFVENIYSTCLRIKWPTEEQLFFDAVKQHKSLQLQLLCLQMSVQYCQV